ncbi:hypothetical protein [Krasilnikovia sp. M28-CT-15]
MTVADVYHYGTRHYDFHRAQLTLEPRPSVYPPWGASRTWFGT